MERGRRLGIDVGSVRVGVAICDPDGLIATPLITLPAVSAISTITELVSDYEIVEIVIGLPRHLKGTAGAAVVAVEAFADELRTQSSVPLVFIDERLTTTSAARQLSAAGRNSKEAKGRIDQAAAANTLQLFLDRERSR